MKIYQLGADLEGAPKDVRTIHGLLADAFRTRGEEMPRMLAVASCESTADEHTYETYFELAPGVVLSTTFGSPEDIEGSEFPIWEAPRVAEEAELSIRSYLATGVDRLADILHDLRLRARRRLAVSSGTDGAAQLIGIRLTADGWHVGGRRHVRVRLEGLDLHLMSAAEELQIDDLDTFDAQIDRWGRTMASRYAARRTLALDGASGSIDLLTLNAISTFADPAAWIRSLSSRGWPSTPDDIVVFARNGKYRSHGSDSTSALTWNRDTVQYPTFVPATVLVACTGRPITDLIEHPMLSEEMIIRGATCVVENKEAVLSVTIEQPRLLFCVNSGRIWRSGETDGISRKAECRSKGFGEGPIRAARCERITNRRVRRGTPTP